MKLLLDTCVWGGAKRELKLAGHDVIWAGDWAEDPGDEEILAKAYGEHRVMVTLDKDFGELAVIHGLPHYGIVRLVNISATRQAAVCCICLDRYGNELLSGGIVTATEDRVRIRRGHD